MQFLSLKCLECAGPLQSTPDSLINICQYCGKVYQSKDIGQLPLFVAPSLNEPSIMNAFHQRMASDSDMRGKKVEVAEIRGQYVPFYIINVTAQGFWRGYRTERRGKTTVKVNLSGSINFTSDYPILARKYAYEFGLPYLPKHIFTNPPTTFDKIDWSKASLPVLSVEYNANEAEEHVRDEFLDELAEKIKASERVEAFTSFEANVMVRNFRIILYPLWNLTYRYMGGSYRVAIEGVKGTTISAMEPVFFKHRLGYFLLSLGAGLLSGIVAWIAQLFVMNANDDESSGKVVIFAIIIIIALIVFAFKYARKIVSSVRVETK